MASNTIAEIQLSYSANIPPDQRIKVSSSKEAYYAFMNSWDKSIIELQEEFKVLYLNRGNQILGTYSLSKGGISVVQVDIRIIFAIALKCAASSLIVAHNHPSGTLNPSQHDQDMTRKLVASAKLLEITLLDHLIITPISYYSFADEGML